MNPRTREHAIRVVTAALLNSTMTSQQLREVADELDSNTNPTFLIDAGVLLRQFLAHLHERGSKKPSKLSEPTNHEDMAHQIIQRRRLSKKEVLDLMSVVTGRSSDSWQINMPLRQMLRDFFNAATGEQIQRFLSLIQPHGNDDAFLRGIIQRR